MISINTQTLLMKDVLSVIITETTPIPQYFNRQKEESVVIFELPAISALQQYNQGLQSASANNKGLTPKTYKSASVSFQTLTFKNPPEPQENTWQQNTTSAADIHGVIEVFNGLLNKSITSQIDVAQFTDIIDNGKQLLNCKALGYVSCDNTEEALKNRQGISESLE